MMVRNHDEDDGDGDGDEDDEEMVVKKARSKYVEETCNIIAKEPVNPTVAKANTKANANDL